MVDQLYNGSYEMGMITPIPTAQQLPLCVGDGHDEVWWFNSDDDSWQLGVPLLMDLEDEATIAKWSHWLPKEAIPLP